jgi:hypothetical protein
LIGNDIPGSKNTWTDIMQYRDWAIVATPTLGQPITKGQESEITSGYNGSSSDEKAIGVTIGLNADGTPIGRTEDHAGPRPYFKPLCNDGQCGGVSKVPNLGNSYDIVWAADKGGTTCPGNVCYRGYVAPRDGSGREYQIANLKVAPGGPLDFTNPGQNTYLRGRSNQLGNTVPTGFISSGHYTPNGQQVITM